MWQGMWGWGPGWGWFGVMHLLFWGLVIAVVFAFFRSLAGGRAAGRGAADRAQEILRERYARGEIDQREYDERRRHLDGAAAQPETDNRRIP